MSWFKIAEGDYTGTFADDWIEIKSSEETFQTGYYYSADFFGFAAPGYHITSATATVNGRPHNNTYEEIYEVYRGPVEAYVSAVFAPLTAISSSHTHAWATAWSANETHHWHECTAADCFVTANEGKDGYGAHTGGTATSTAKAVCSVCGNSYGLTADAVFEDADTEGKYYASLGEAIANGSTGVKLLKNIDSATINSGESITINLNGMTIASLVNEGTVVLPYNTTGGSITTLSGSGTLAGDILLYDDSKMTILGGTIKAEIDTYDNSELIIKGGTFTDEIDSHDSSVVVIEGGTFNEEVESRGDSTMTVNGGTFTNDLNARGTSRMTVNNGSFDLQADSVDSSTFIINNGTFKQITECRDKSAMTINGGTFSDDRADKDVALQLKETGTLTIKGGTFLNSIVDDGEPTAKLLITGGAFVEDPSAFVGEGYDVVQDANGRFGVAVHVHTWEEGWSNDANNHWHNCTSPKCDTVDSLGGHRPNIEAPTEDCDQVCTVCGRLLAAKLEHIPVLVGGYEATTTAPGKKDYYHCDGCGKNYADAEGTSEITEDIEAWRAIPMIIAIVEGNNQAWTKGTNGDLTFKSNANFADFLCVEIDGAEVEASNYTAKEGSIIVTLKASYIDTLSVGEHTITIASAGDRPKARFTVKTAAGGSTGGNSGSTNNNSANANTAAVTNPNSGAISPKTGDNSPIALWIALSAVGVWGLAGTMFILKRKRAR